MSDESEQSSPGHVDNSLARLLTLADGIFAIAMTLLALELKVPSLGEHPSEHRLVHALAANADSYWTFALTFYVVAQYWLRHRHLMRSAVRHHPAVTRDTLWLLLLVAAMPFPASLLARYGSDPVALVVYGCFNAAATALLLLLSWDMKRLDLADHTPTGDEDYSKTWRSWLSLVTFVLCIPAGLLFGGHGVYVLLLLAVPQRVRLARKGVGLARRKFGS